MSDLADGITITRQPLRGMITLRGDFADTDFKNAVTGLMGVDIPGIRAMQHSGGRSVAWMSPDELMLMLPYGDVTATLTTIAKALGSQHHLAADVSDARVIFALKGPGAREVLAKGAPVDLSPAAFGSGEIRRTRLGQVACAFWMTDEDAFEIMAFASVAEFVAEWLNTAARKGSLPHYFAASGPAVTS